MTFKSEPHHYYEIFYIETERKTYYEAKTVKINSINIDVKSQRESIQTVNLFSSDLSHAHATCIVTSSLLAYKSHTKDAGLARNSQK